MTDRLASAVVVNCEFVRRHLKQVTKACRLRGSGFATTESIRGVLRARGYPAGGASGRRLVIGVVCALRPEKGIEDLLEAFRRVRGAGAVKLAIVGSGPMRKN